MRGTREVRRFRYLECGIIPAYAGNTSGSTFLNTLRRDHPRVCGEHGAVREPVCRKVGSSPRMRGTPERAIGCVNHVGIIPAYAGNTLRGDIGRSCTGDHPRVCGEHIEYKVEGATSQGSSPRMRGTHPSARPCALYCGIIPAYAGNTLFGHSVSFIGKDHPRVCGEHTKRL